MHTLNACLALALHLEMMCEGVCVCVGGGGGGTGLLPRQGFKPVNLCFQAKSLSLAVALSPRPVGTRMNR